MGSQESTILSLPDKELIQNIQTKKYFWVTKKDNKEITRMVVDKMSLINLNTKIDPLRPDIPFFILWNENYPHIISEKTVAGPDSYIVSETGKTRQISDYKLYILDFKYQGNEIRKEIQIYEPHPNTGHLL